YHIAHGGGHVLPKTTLNAIRELDRSRVDPKSNRGGATREQGTLAAMAGIAILLRELRPAARAFKRQAAHPQGLECGQVPLGAIALMSHLIVPFEAEAVQGAQNARGGTRHHARSIQILDADQPAP